MKPLVGLVAACLLFSQTSDASQLYRFKVDGKTFIEHHIPPQYADYGYEVLNNRGIVVEVVPPAPTKEELEPLAAKRPPDKAGKKPRLNKKKNKKPYCTYTLTLVMSSVLVRVKHLSLIHTFSCNVVISMT